MSDEERRDPFEEHIESDEFDISQLRYSELSAEDFVLQLSIFALLDKSSHPLAKDLYSQLGKQQRILCDLLIIELISQLRDAPEYNALAHLSNTDVTAMLRGPVAAALMLGAAFPTDQTAPDSQDDLAALFDHEDGEIDDDDDDFDFVDGSEAGDTSSYHNPFSSSLPHSSLRGSYPSNWYDRRSTNHGTWSAFDFSQSDQYDDRQYLTQHVSSRKHRMITSPPQPPLRSSLYFLLVLHRVFETIGAALSGALQFCKRSWDRLRRIWFK